MYAVVLYQNGSFVKLCGFVNSMDEYDAIAQQIADRNGGFERLANLGYELCAELAG